MRRLLLFALAAVVVACGGESAKEPVTSDALPPPSAASPAGETANTASDDDTVDEASGGLLPGHAAGADVVLVTLDTLRHDVLGFSGHPEAQTPHLDRLAGAGRVFTSAYAHNVVTLPSHANILTGLYPYEHGVRENSGFVLGDGVPTLATRLAAAGYATGAFVAAFPLDARYGLDRGFDVYDDDYPSGSALDQFVAPERRGDEVVAAALAWWQGSAGTKRFLWVHLYDPHAPYAAPEPYASRFPDDPYLAEVAATDAFLAPLLKRLEAETERPFLAVTSDHGEALGEHGELTHGLFCYEATLKIPLVLWGPGIEPGTDDTLAGHVDLVPTILHALGLSRPENLPGRSLLAAGERSPERTVYFEALTSYLNRGWAPLRGLLEGSSKMIELPLPELYDVARDPAEAENLFRPERDLFQRLRARLPVEDPWPPSPEREIAPEEAAALRSLGYVAASGTKRTSFRPEDDPKNLIEVDAKLHKIVEAYSTGRLEAAAVLAQEVIAARPDMPVGYEHLAMSLRQLERPAEAIAVLEAALERGLLDDSLLRQLGLTYAENGLARKAIEVLEPLAGRDDPETLNAYAVALSDADRHAEAMNVLERSLAVDGNEAKTFEALGVVTLRLGRPGEARRHLETALEHNDALPYTWNTLGVVHAYENRPQEAIAAWEKAIALDPRQLDALYNLGMTAARIGRRDTARRALERYVGTAPPARYGPDIAEARRVLRGLGD